MHVALAYFLPLLCYLCCCLMSSVLSHKILKGTGWRNHEWLYNVGRLCYFPSQGNFLHWGFCTNISDNLFTTTSSFMFSHGFNVSSIAQPLSKFLLKIEKQWCGTSTLLILVSAGNYCHRPSVISTMFESH